MRLIKQTRQSPAIAVAAIALIAAIAGTAVAADPGATTAKLDKKEKKQVKKIARKQANKRINKKAPKLAVDHANTAGSATTADSVGDGGVTTSSFAPDTRGVALAGAYVDEGGTVSRWFNRFGGQPTVQQGDEGFTTVNFPGLGQFDARLIGQATLASGPGGEIAVQENEGNPRVVTWASDGALTNRTFQLLIFEGSGEG